MFTFLGFIYTRSKYKKSINITHSDYSIDDTLLLVKPEQIDEIMQEFYKNLKFTVDKFENSVPHFLDLEIHPDGVSIYRKDTHTAQFVNYNSYTKFNHKVAWMRSLVTRAKQLCSPNKLKEEMKNIRKFASYNGFPRKRSSRKSSMMKRKSTYHFVSRYPRISETHPNKSSKDQRRN